MNSASFESDKKDKSKNEFELFDSLCKPFILCIIDCYSNED